MSRGLTWFTALTGSEGRLEQGPKTVLAAEAALGREPAKFLAVVPDPNNRFPRARHGEVGLDEGWALAREIRETITADGMKRKGGYPPFKTPQGGIPSLQTLPGRAPRPIIAIVDVSSQAYGRREELLGIHLACAAAVDAYASARQAGHPVVALIVGKAMSGAFLAHGYQANRILALDSPEVLIHAMGKQAAARVTRRSVEELEQLGERIPPMAYHVKAFASLGLLHRLIAGVNADAPSVVDVERVRNELVDAVADARKGGPDLFRRLLGDAARQTRAASIEVRRRLAEQWDDQ